MSHFQAMPSPKRRKNRQTYGPPFPVLGKIKFPNSYAAVLRPYKAILSYFGQLCYIITSIILLNLKTNYA
jgi:hypothetical protein